MYEFRVWVQGPQTARDLRCFKGSRQGKSGGAAGISTLRLVWTCSYDLFALHDDLSLGLFWGF